VTSTAFLLVTMCALGGAGCAESASTTTPATPAAGPVCEVILQQPLFTYRSTVVGDQAEMQGTLGPTRGAYYNGASDDIWMDTVLGSSQTATLQGNSIVVKGLLADGAPIVIGEREARVPGLFTDTPIAFSENCTKRQAALGVVTLVTVIEAQNHQH
jgi:hypothetical protein